MTQQKIHFNVMPYSNLSQSVLITGGNGLVGSELTFGKRLTRQELDLTDRNATIKYFVDYRPEWVVHCAGLVGGIQANMTRKAEFFQQNLLMGLNVLEAAYIAKVPNLITFLSTCIFPEKHAKFGQLHEDLIHDGHPHESNNAYAYAKRMLDVGIMAYKEQYNVKNWFSLIPTNLYGPNDNYHPINSHLIAALIQKAHIAKTTNTPLIVGGTGKPLREFVYVKDIAKLIYQMITMDFQSPYDKIIVSPAQPYCIKDVAKIVCNIFEINDYRFDTSYPDGQQQKLSNNNRFRELFPNFVFTPLHIGLQDTIEYYLTNISNIRQ